MDNYQVTLHTINGDVVSKEFINFDEAVGFLDRIVDKHKEHLNPLTSKDNFERVNYIELWSKPDKYKNVRECLRTDNYHEIVNKELILFFR